VDNQITKLDHKLHEHLEIDHGDILTYVNVFEIEQGLTQIVMGSHDKEGKLVFNKHEMFLEADKFEEFVKFFDKIYTTIVSRKSRKILEDIMKDISIESQRQVDFVEVDDDHVDLKCENLGRDIQDSVVIKTKMRNSKDYCKRFYATLCNNELYKEATITSYSWRSTGGLVADILCYGDYMDWYCSGNEGHIDEEIESDLSNLGWCVKPYVDDKDEYVKQRLL